MNNQMILKNAEAENKTRFSFRKKTKSNKTKTRLQKKKTEQNSVQKNAIKLQLIRKKRCLFLNFLKKEKHEY